MVGPGKGLELQNWVESALDSKQNKPADYGLELSHALHDPRFSIVLKRTLRKLLERLHCKYLPIRYQSYLVDTSHFHGPYITSRVAHSDQYLKYIKLRRQCESYQHHGVGGAISIDSFIERVSFVENNSNFSFSETLRDVTTSFNKSR